jgi:hypothetical protein
MRFALDAIRLSRRKKNRTAILSCWLSFAKWKLNRPGLYKYIKRNQIMEITFVVGAASALVSAVLTYFFTTHYHVQRVAGSQSGDDHVLDLRLDQEFHRGKEVGKSEELGKFTLSYEPFAETIEEYLGMRKRSTLGYDMQISYSGFPIGHKTRYITHQNIEYDEKRIDALLNNEVASTINNIIQLAATKGMGVKALPKRTNRAAT